MNSRRGRIRNLIATAAGALVVAGLGLPAHAAPAMAVNNLSAPGTLGEIRIRPVMQEISGATALQRGVPNNAATNPNRTVGDYVIPLTFNSPGLRLLGSNHVSINPSAADGHTHYHAGDTRIIVNDATGFALGDTIQIGSPYCNFAFLDLNCKRGFPSTNEQPSGQVNYIVGGDAGTPGPGVFDLAFPLASHPTIPGCVIIGSHQCAFAGGEQIVKLPTAYPGQQFRVDIPHMSVVNGSPNDVVVTADLIGPIGSNDPSAPRTPLPLSRDVLQDFDVIIDNACGVPVPPPPCGAGFVSFYVPKTATVTGTIGRTFSVDNGHTWYQVIVTARDAVTGAVRADGVARMKLNPVAILNASTGGIPGTLDITPDPAFILESVTIKGFLRDNSSAVALQRRPVEDVIADVEIEKPSGLMSRYGVTSCTDTNPGPADPCGSDAFGNLHNHGALIKKIGGIQGLSIGLPPLSGTTLNCDAGPFNPFNPSTYPNVFGVPECVVSPLLSPFDTIEPGTYDVAARLRQHAPDNPAFGTFDVGIGLF